MRVFQLATLSLVTLFACTDGADDPAQDPIEDPPGETRALSADEEADLLFMREEEKLARDVYDALDVYGQPFANVQLSEQRHFDTLGGLLVTYGLEDPAAGNGVGEFTSAELQALHDELVASGLPSREAALMVGCGIEELDLRDIAEAKARTTRSDIITAYDNLMLGSRNHLRAYYSTLTSAGGTYTPIYITQTEFDAVVSSPREQGGN